MPSGAGPIHKSIANTGAMDNREKSLPLSASQLDVWADEPDRSIGRLDILSSEQRRMLLEDFNATACPVPETTLSELFEAQVARSPEAAALVFEEVVLSYAELNLQANRL